ncbi:predicted protein [Naegleria gruberi]|uniref:Predicted protein n=1 Tax=Naegleria gruberi TaxID=5762 RepID=D2VLL7_NAEGR|nr:uncharacterized protein NAEGRDRAFT_69826 [Naegleria gruberi]EFC42411.1 predicted protein [Naegleria gruberi]|eukprot:XP_002675155.1 predicted protein [Naegleria gruberi strain NEG-M]
MKALRLATNNEALLMLNHNRTTMEKQYKINENDEEYDEGLVFKCATCPSPSDDQWEDVLENSKNHIEDDQQQQRIEQCNDCDEDELSKDSSLDEAVHDLEYIESTCSMIQNSASSIASPVNGPTAAVNSRKVHHLSSPKSNKHFYNHKRNYKRSISSPSFLLNHKAGNSLFETNTFEFVLVNTEEHDSSSSSCCKYNEKIENRDQKAMEICKNKSCAPLDVVLERLEYKLQKIEKLEKKSQQEEEIKQRYVNVKKKFLRMLELGMVTSQRESQNSPPDDSIDILHKAKHNKKAILYLQSPEKFSHFLSRKALKYYYKLCQIARYGTPKSEFAATRILDNLFLGDIDDAFNEPVLKQLGITHIVTCVKSLEPIYPEKGFEEGNKFWIVSVGSLHEGKIKICLCIDILSDEKE